MTAGAGAEDGSNLKGALLLVISAFIATIEVILMRRLGERVNSGQIVVFRGLAQLLFVGSFVLATQGIRGTYTTRYGLHAIRGTCSAISWGFYYISIVVLDLAVATTLTFTSSLFVVAMAGPILAERVGVARWSAAIAGFIGVAIVTRVGSSAFDPAVTFGVLSSLFGACIVMMNRVMARTESTMTIMFYVGVVTSILAIPVGWFTWKPLSSADFGIVLLIAIIGTTGMWCNIEAYRAGEVSALAPYPYLRLLFAIAAGYLVYAEVPGISTLAGAAIIVAAVLGLTYHEARQRRRIVGRQIGGRECGSR